LRERAQLDLVDDMSVTADVLHGDASLAQDPGDEKPTVAMRGVFLAAKHRHAIVVRTLEQSSKPRVEPFSPGHRAVQHMTFLVVELRFRGTTA
jgi:hypothetical protein